MKIAVLGVGVIGKVHIKILNKLGIKEPYFLSRTEESGKKTSDYLYNSYGIRSKYYSSLESLISNGLDGAIICLPSEFHYEYLIKLFNHKIPVFCEKPLFWNNCDTYYDVKLKLREISNYKEKILLINTCNNYFIKELKKHENLIEPIKSFRFNFFTNGSNRHVNIGVDLLPHALSLLIELLGNREIKNLKIDDIEPNKYFCSFTYDKSYIEFDLRESQEIKKKLSFKINDVEYERIQETLDSNYKVSLKNLKNGNQYYMKDPFEVYMQKFIDTCTNRNSIDVEDSLINFKKMCEIIHG
ncbi:Gfo/Idh/MocA family oxidoreductase [Gammaproteobacteria bacterium]|nr:Gfo/Idh/MocA family oxidoreductase [Gammaproteobacteria bacterium]